VRTPLISFLLAPGLAHADIAPDAVVDEVELAVGRADPKTARGEPILAGRLAPSTDVAAGLKRIRDGPGFPQSAGPLVASGFRPLVAESVTTRRGPHATPDHITTTNRFAVAHGKYARVDTKQVVGVCHHCAIWSCTAR